MEVKSVDVLTKSVRRVVFGLMVVAAPLSHAECDGQGQSSLYSDEVMQLATRIANGGEVQLQPGSELETKVGEALACVTLPPITVTPGSPPPTWLPPSYGGGNGGLGGGGGSGNPPPQVPYTLPRPPDADDDVNCGSIGEVRTTYARVNVVYARMRSGTMGSPLNGNPAPGVPFSVRYGNGQKESFVAGPYGSPTLSVASAIQGSCY